MVNAALIGVTVLIILNIALLFYVAIDISPEESFASAIMSIMLLIYVTGLFGDTKIAIWIIYIMAILGIIAAIITSGRKKAFSLKRFLSPSIVMIGIIVVVAVVVFDGMQICNWDELYQWGKAANYMVEFDKLPSGADFAGESVLLSSTTFFHYFIAKLSALVQGTVTESNYYVSNLLLWFSALALPFSGAGWKQWKRVFSFGLFHFLLASIIFVQPYYNIYTDQATAYWAGGMIAWLLAGKCRKKTAYLIPLVLINVGLMKSMVGPLFAVIVILAFLVLYVVDCKEKGIHVLPPDWKKKLFSKKGLAGIGIAASPFLLMGVWSVLTNQNGIFRYNGGAQEGEKDRAILTLKSMISWIFDSVTLKDDSIYLSYGIFIIITVAFVYIVYPLVIGKKELKRYQSLMYVYIAGFAAYFLVMYVAYMCVFEYANSINATSLNRYFSDYMMLGVVPLTVPLFQWTVEESKPFIATMKKGLLVVFTICIVAGSSDYFLENLVHLYALDVENYAAREKIDKYCEEIKELTNETGKIYFINQKKSGMLTLAADYEMDEQLSRNGMCFKFRKDTSEAISGLTDYPIDTLPTVLKEQGYSYIWIYSTDDYFTSHFKNLFDLENVKNGNFYKVVCDGEQVELEYIDRIK